MIARHHRHAGLFHQPLGGVLQPHGADRGRRRADEDEPCRRHLVDEIGVFRQEAVAGMDRLGAGRQRRRDDLVAAQIAFADRRGADMHRLVGHLDMQRLGVGVGIDGDGAHAQPARRADDAAGDLAAIGDQDLGEHAASRFAAGGASQPGGRLFGKRDCAAAARGLDLPLLQASLAGLQRQSSAAFCDGAFSRVPQMM